jgi:predicted metal-dependent hydrolase
MCSVNYGGALIEFELVRADRATLEIAVLPDGAVVVKAPTDALEDEVLPRVARRSRWILKQQRYFAQFQPRTPPRRYVGGETHLYLGRQYRLAIEVEDVETVKLVSGWFRVTLPQARLSSENVRGLLEGWYAQKARQRLPERLEQCWQVFPRAGLDQPALRIRRMRTRWGSLSNAGTLSLHPDLVQAPRECIDYVIMHELCHLVHPDHGPGFRRLLERVLPDWERRKTQLEITLA